MRSASFAARGGRRARAGRRSRIHGNASGIDTALAASGGVALYRKGSPLEPLRLGRKLTLVVGHSGEPGDTKQTVASVKHQHDCDPAKVEQISTAWRRS